MTRVRARAGAALTGSLLVMALFAPGLATNDPGEQFPTHLYAPPMWPHVRDDDGRWRRPFVYPIKLVDRLELRFEQDRARRVPLRWFSRGSIVSVDPADGPWLPLGGDRIGRDVYSRLLFGARLSLGVALLAVAGAIVLGGAIGAVAGFFGGRLETFLMAFADLFIVLPVIYVVLAVRATLPLVLTTAQVFWGTAGILALAGWPFVARGIRAIVAAESRREYAESARAIGASPWRILHRHLLPAASGFLLVQGSILLPAFVLAEATLSFVGLGFSEPAASWGGMLREAAPGHAFTDAPWLLAPAVAIALTMLGVQLAIDERPFSGSNARKVF